MIKIGNLKKFNIDGNRIAVFGLISKEFENFELNLPLRQSLVKTFRGSVDSVMVFNLLNSDTLRTYVFEPNNGEKFGAVSTMCGNGLKALSFVTGARKFVTDAGEFQKFEINKKSYICTNGCKDIDGLINASVFRSCVEDMNSKVKSVRLLGNTLSNESFGEPHLTILLEGKLTKKQLIDNVTQWGFKLGTLSDMQVNVTFVSYLENFEINVCTFERNLGSDPKVAITGSCGTGAMAAATIVDQYYNIKGGAYRLFFPKGIQEILIKNNQTYLLVKNNYESI